MLKIEIKEKNKQEALFFKHLNPINKDGNYSKNSLVEKLKKEYKSASSKTDKDIYRFLIIRLKNIITGNPQLLNEIISLFNDMFSIEVFHVTNAKGEKEESEIAKKLKEIFNYKTFRSSSFCIEYLKKLGFEKRIPCPYCNFDELSIITRDVEKNELALLDLDHFVPQSKYPFLALSMYNLVPSCHNCNSRFKQKILFLVNTHINPFDKSFDEYFHFKLEYPFVFGMELDDFLITYEIINDFCDKTIIDLKLVERYNTAKEELIRKFNILAKMTSNKTNELEDLLEDSIKDDILILADIPTDKEDITKYRLGKLKRDIYEDTWKNN